MSRNRPDPKDENAHPTNTSNVPKQPKKSVAAFRDMEPAGPQDADVQVRQAGREATRTDDGIWDETDEASDESFPASDPAAKY